MSRRGRFVVVLILAAGAFGGFVGCSNEEPENNSALCVSMSSWDVPGNGGTSQSITVDDCGGSYTFDWAVEKHASWLTLTHSTGNTPGSFAIRVAANAGADGRADTLRITAPSAKGSPKTLIVTQGPGKPTLCVSPKSWIAPPEGGPSPAFEVTNCGDPTSIEWSAAWPAGWLSPESAAGSTPGSFSLAAAPNTSGADRADTVRVSAAAAGAAPKVVLVLQPFSLLASPRDYEVGKSPCALVTSDVNDDGFADLVVANYGSDDVATLLNNGNGTFANALFHPVLRKPLGVTCADFDGDRSNEIAVVYEWAHTVSVLDNLGGGLFGMPVNYAVGGYTTCVSAADLNGDGSVDLVVGAFDHGPSILLNKGDGTFASYRELPEGRDASSIVCADFDGDGDKDIAAALGGGLGVLLNNGDGTFGKLSLYGTTGQVYLLAAGDFNGDGAIDVATDWWSGYLCVFRNDGRGAFPSPRSFPIYGWADGLSAADLDGDAHVDIAFTTGASSQNVGVLRNDGAGAFRPAIYFSAGFSPRPIACADLDGDRDPDVVVGNCGVSARVYTVTVMKNFTRMP